MKLNQNHFFPKDGIAGLKENFWNDLLSGFMVALLALPLSLGIAQASDFPNPFYGILTAIIGGMLLSFFTGSALTVKGPAAGLIVIMAGSITEFGGGVVGWRFTLGAIIVAGLLQIIFGVFKLGKLVNFFPLSVVHGMLAAIGLIILSKQLHVVIGVNPLGENGKPLINPFELFKTLPDSFYSVGQRLHVVITGLSCLALVFLLPLLPQRMAKKIPVPLVVLLVSIPLGSILGLNQIQGGLIHFKTSFLDIIGIPVDFGGWRYAFIFLKYVLLIALIGSLESLLIVKAVDLLDPYQRKSDSNKELRALGGGNMVSGLMGGLPIIAEMARSAANVNYGAKTRWANFFHGVFLLIFMLLLMPFIEKIPNAALAALLIGVGYNLAHPRHFIEMYHSGKAKLIVFIITIFFTLINDLLTGIFSGLLADILIRLYQKKTVRSDI
ncbi:MAG: SulP family inorganic anion transporter [Bacteroidetes bacterium]|nr:SulP family inorganic anion transporter [Bacteroidota bacterium]